MLNPLSITRGVSKLNKIYEQISRAHQNCAIVLWPVPKKKTTHNTQQAQRTEQEKKAERPQRERSIHKSDMRNIFLRNSSE